MQYVIGVIVGAVIGYLTNWLAIKMLFRPRTEKRILGVKVPFTPGLIPKEKDRIARNVSESVGEHLLNRESIGRALKEPEVKVKVKEALVGKVDNILLAEGTLKERIDSVFGEKSNTIISLGENKAKEKIIKVIKEKAEEKVISKFIFDEIKKQLSENPKYLINFIEQINSEKLSKEIIKLIPKEELYTVIENIIKDKFGELEEDNKLIGDIVPEGVFQAVDNYIINHKEEICLEICKTLRKEEVSYRIKEKIEENLFRGLKGIVTRFFSVDLVYDKMIEALESYLDDEKNQKIVCSCISNYINSVSEVKVESFIENMPGDLNSKVSKLIGDKGTEIILNPESINNIKNLIISYINRFESYDSLIKSMDEFYEEKLENKIDLFVNKIVYSERIETLIGDSIIHLKEEILNYDLSGDIEKAKMVKSLVENIIDKNYDRIVDKEIPNVLEVVNIPKIIEDQINSFDVDYGEKLIIEIANKELKAITWLGALLGGVLGILSPIIGSIKF